MAEYQAGVGFLSWGADVATVKRALTYHPHAVMLSFGDPVPWCSLNSERAAEVAGPAGCSGRHDGTVQRVVVLGRGGAGKSTLARRLGELTGLPVTELDTLFWQPGLIAADPAEWAGCQRELVRGEAWILDGDLGPYDSELAGRLGAADTIIVLNFAFLRCAWRTVLRGREGADYWRWVWSYRRQSLPEIIRTIHQAAPGATVYLLRRPGMVRRLLAGPTTRRSGSSGRPPSSALSSGTSRTSTSRARRSPPGPATTRRGRREARSSSALKALAGSLLTSSVQTARASAACIPAWPAP